MNSDLELDERRAAALPHDFPGDFHLPHGTDRSDCERCLHTFVGLRSRTMCRVCKESEAPP